MEYQDDRTEEQKITHAVIVGMTDRFMSGWGKADGGTSYAGWACTDQDAPAIERWIRSRMDASRVRVMYRTWKPRGKGHCHIYVVGESHPAIMRAGA
jgi:hypothetical protein